MMRQKIRKICSICGSEDIEFKGRMHWDEGMQEYRLDDLFKYPYCLECQEEVNVTDKLLPVELNDQIKVL